MGIMTENKTQIFNKLAVLGLWTLLLVGTITNGLDVLGMLLTGATLDTITTIIKNISMVILGISLVPVFLKEKKVIISTLLIFGALWYWSSTKSPLNTPFLLSNMQAFFLEGLPYLWFFAYFIESDNTSSNNLFNLLYKICRMKLIIALVTQMIMFIAPQTDIFHDYMNAANALLLGLLVVAAHNMRSKHSRRSDNIMEVVAVLSILALGSRGGVLCYGSFYLLYFLFMTSGKKKVTYIWLGAIALLFMYLLMPAIIESLAGSNNRLAKMFSSNTLVHDDNRALIYTILLRDFADNPLGMGIMADRAILTTSNEIWETFYAHNLFLELIVDFGYIGIFASILLVVWIVRQLRKSSSYNVLLLCILVSCSFVKLMVSSSLWLDPIFWALIGSLWCINKRNKILQS